MIVGNRVDIDRRKKNPLDFVLWKPTSKIISVGIVLGVMVGLDGISSVQL